MSNYANERQAERDLTYQTSNYPSANDTTSEGGYGSPEVFTPQSQRRADFFQSHPQYQSQRPSSQPDSSSNSSDAAGLIDQSVDGGPLARELQDAAQGADRGTREQYAHEAKRDFAPSAASGARTGAQGLNPYGRNPDSTQEAGERLAAGYADQRGRQFESGAARSGEGDPGAF
ncbi:hypothetical protein GY45DRAFT_1373461 [Cubamyces sp. BRFM 1775]|nr:hypothetical protein GY45DRAFT_1373461 [Cubamyces sp. BRFM 1775]